MSQPFQSFLTSPQGKLRVWCGVFLLGLPLLLVIGWFLDSSATEWHVSGSERLVTSALLTALMVASFSAGIYYTFFQRSVDLDPGGGWVTANVRIGGATIHRRVWKLSEFRHIELRHRSYGDGPSDTFQSDVGIRHSSGFVIWLRGFLSPPDGPSSEALSFVQELSKKTGLLYDKGVA